MTSGIWQLDPAEGIDRPYEYAVQEQFVREAEALFPLLYRLMNSDRHRYSTEDRSPAKATWLLQMEALDSLRECLWALKQKRHRSASALFRTADELLDLAAFLASGDPAVAGVLRRWYEDEFIGNSEYRGWAGRTQGGSRLTELREKYQALSRFTHRTYKTILYGYSLGAEDRLVHDRTAEIYGECSDADTMLVVPQTLAYYYAILANGIRRFADEACERGCAASADVEAAFKTAMESEQVPWRFMTAGEVWEQRKQCRSNEGGEDSAGREVCPPAPEGQ